MQIIETKQGQYLFEPQEFTLGSKIIGRAISKENLILFKQIMEKNNIAFSLAYGTLLGAIRENNFIAHDEDTDVAILAENENDFLNILFELKENDFVVGRYEQNLLSIIRKGEYIDIYIFEKSLFGYRKFANEVLKEEYLLETIKYNFLDNDFNIPSKYIQYLEEHYGNDWKIPKKNMHACNPGIYLSIKLFIQNNFKILFKIIGWTKKKLYL